MTILRKAEAGTVGVVAVLVLAFYYLAFRYPFRINDANTSPTYSDTPLFLQVLKYVLFALVLLVVVAVLVEQRRYLLPWRKQPGRNWLLLFLIVWPGIQTLFGGEAGAVQIGLFMTLPLLVGATQSRSFSVPVTFNVIRVFFWVALAFELLQLALFFMFNRLPALAYAGTYSVRFGSVWDDPNGFGMVIALLMPFMLVASTRIWTRITVVAASVAMLALTQSLTAWAAVSAALLIGASILWSDRRRERRLLWGFFLGSLAVAAVLHANGVFGQFLGDKANSIAGHFSSVETLLSVSAWQLLGLAPGEARIGESGLVNLISSTGVPYATAYSLIVFASILQSYRRIRTASDQKMKAVFTGVFVFLIAYAIGITNLPLEQAFPLNALLAVAVTLPWLSSRSPMRSSATAKNLDRLGGSA